MINLLILFQAVYGQAQRLKGYPEKDVDILPGFIHPPKGYGNVPFYWWNGDSLNKNRLREQLDILSSSALDGFAVSYMHLHPEVDVEEMKGGYGLFGKTEPGKPEVFSEEWWDIWSWFAEECASRNIGLGLDDYTVGWIGNGFYPDELQSMPEFAGYRGELQITPLPAEPGSVFTCDIPEEIVTAVAYPGKTDLTRYINDGRLTWQVPGDNAYTVYVISTTAGYLLHPDIGKEYVRVYFDRFEKKMGNAAADGMNYFFQDELSYPIRMGTWSEDFEDEFKKRKGYDLTLFLPALTADIGDITPKIRLDYCDVLMDLAEERYFRPIYEWHASRRLIYGSDNLGRGKDPLAYVDYFRANSWYTAPGNDAPSTGSSFLQTKVSSSITHLYERPRTWLEAFHSMGWGSSGAWLTRQMDHHFLAGGNLVCMHGLYYSTHGGWWEWAPPCFHFRMPYWPHIKKWLEYTERLSYLMSQGRHVCDIALMYPTETMQAFPGASPDYLFEQAMKLSNAGLDYDFMDYRSLDKAKVQDGVLSVAGEKYRVILLVDMQAMHHRSLQKIVDFYRSGGIVLAMGKLPEASDRNGKNDPEVEAIVREIFGKSDGTGFHITDHDPVKKIWSLITPDFKPETGTGKVLHRRAGERDVYMVMDVPAGSECFFRSTGKVELWNASDGTVSRYPVVRQTDEGTWLSLEKEPSNSYLLVFSPGEPDIQPGGRREKKQVYEASISGIWETELLPTMDNKWGDFRFPASGMIGAEARTFRHLPAALSPKEWIQPDFDDSEWAESMYGFGAQFRLQQEKEETGDMLEFSWQYGVYGNPGPQGYHGLKGKISDGFFILDKGGHQVYHTWVYAPRKDHYRIEAYGTEPDDLLIGQQQAGKTITLDKGWHQLSVAYANTAKTEHNVEGQLSTDFHNRGAVVLFPQSSPVPQKPSPYDKVISTVWHAGDHLLYDPYRGGNRVWNYRFRSAPGLEGMELSVAGDLLNVWFNGRKIMGKHIRTISTQPSGIRTYRVMMPEKGKEPGVVAFSVRREPGYQGAAVICAPVSLKTGKGLLEAGNWSETGALKDYSGGMYYRKRINIPEVVAGRQVTLHLGKVVASCEVKINGKAVGIVMSDPYSVDISQEAKQGENDIEILVYSTLSNHYQTIPTPYKGDGTAGLLGPVSLTIEAPSDGDHD
ncbi:MAG: hypothetical protein LBQ39_00855 [Tannerellaceae bacterium]|nr:hypothetical protein [Tannerellaceae bacterium]